MAFLEDRENILGVRGFASYKQMGGGAAGQTGLQYTTTLGAGWSEIQKGDYDFTVPAGVANARLDVLGLDVGGVYRFQFDASGTVNANFIMRPGGLLGTNDIVISTAGSYSEDRTIEGDATVHFTFLDVTGVTLASIRNLKIFKL